MKCPKCGYPVSQTEKFCPECGMRLTAGKSSQNRIDVRCKSCDALMEVDEKHHKLTCPYCGTEELLVDSEEVKLEKIRSEMEKEKFRDAKEKERKKEEKSSRDKFKKSIFSKVILVLLIFSALFLVAELSDKMYLTSLVTFVQCVLFLLAWLQGMHYISIRKRDLHTPFVIVGLLMVFLFAAAFEIDQNSQYERYREKTRKENLTKTFVWPSAGLSERLPVPETDNGEIWEDNNEEFRINLYQASNMDYENYVKNCQQMGYTLDSSKSKSSFYAYDKEQYSLEITYDDNEDCIRISLDVPKKSSEFRWSKSSLAQKLPVPRRVYGYIYLDTENTYAVYLTESSEQEFQEYADACWDAGFTSEFRKSADRFDAEDKDGYRVSIKYNSTFRKIYIEIYAN